MKTFIIAILLASGIQSDILSQNRICEWETEKISSIEVEYTSTNNVKDISIFNTQKEMDKILTFLKEVNFRDFDDSNPLAEEQAQNMEYKISFQGQRDQVYLYKHTACIGKTSFMINPDVIMEFNTLISTLIEN